MADHSTTDAITLEALTLFISAQGSTALRTLAEADLDDRHTLPLLAALRRDFAPPAAGALLALARLRRRALVKFPFADQLFLQGEALEQATAWPIAQYRAAWIDRHAPPGPVLDLGCGIGGDTLALAQHRPVIAVERDRLRLHLAQANVAALGLAKQVTFIEADWTTLLAANQLPPASAAFADPARRDGERRIFSLHQMQPPISALLQLQRNIAALGVKVMPSVRAEELPTDASVEFISHAGVCKEALLWFGPLATDQRRASVHSATGWITLADDGNAPPLGDLRTGLFLHEPDPAVIRAGAFAPLCEQLSAWLFDDQIAYLVAAVQQSSPLVQTFVVREVHDFSLRRLNQRLEALDIGAVELKKRGFPTEPESLRPRLKLQPGGRPLVVIFTRRGDQRLMILAERLPPVRE
jgi:hypothetical protein